MLECDIAPPIISNPALIPHVSIGSRIPAVDFSEMVGGTGSVADPERFHACPVLPGSDHLASVHLATLYGGAF
jgi:hypothetical protein